MLLQKETKVIRHISKYVFHFFVVLICHLFGLFLHCSKKRRERERPFSFKESYGISHRAIGDIMVLREFFLKHLSPHASK